MVLGGSLPPRCRAAGPLPPSDGAGGGLPPGRGAAGSRQGYKSSAPSLASSFYAHKIQRWGEGERTGEGGNSTGEALPDFGSEPQVTNIS